MLKFSNYFTHIYTMWAVLLISLSWIIRYNEISTFYLVSFIILSIFPLIQLYKYYISKSINIWSRRIK